MTRVSEEELGRLTLMRQFPTVRGTGPEEVVQLVDHLGPLQSQVPRAPFVALAARLPGTTYETVCTLFESFQLLRASNLRGTVHTSTRRCFGRLDAVARKSRAGALRRALLLETVTAAEVDAEVRSFSADGWRARSDILAHVRDWLVEHESSRSSAALAGAFSESVVWGNSGLARRPRGTAWETRTDTWHHTADVLVPELDRVPPATALVGLVRGHLAAHGPVTRADLAFFFGAGLTEVDALLLGFAAVQTCGAARGTHRRHLAHSHRSVDDGHRGDPAQRRPAAGGGRLRHTRRRPDHGPRTAPGRPAGAGNPSTLTD